ncbi:MAG: ATP-dependent helicase HrpB [Polyangiaceae bacterium]|nr:ATP-dependent helicase HrpB [Polyangiaceae bacterium]
MQPLPIDAVVPEIVRAVAEAGVVVVEAEPGAGKTTRVPAALLEAASHGSVVVTEPRRIAARLAARRVAEERGEPLGGLVGYSVRFDERSGPSTRLLYVTEGVLLRRLARDPRLADVVAVVVDEVHERHVETDLVLSLVSELRRERPELALVVMSATLDAEPLARFLGGARRVRCPGRLHPLAITHQEGLDDRPLEKRVASAVRQGLREEPDGDVLVFLPGAPEIRRASDALAGLADAERVRVLPLHGDLPLDVQARALERGSQRKVVLSTNVAESSVTVEGVAIVVDSGLARVASHSPWSGLPRLEVATISRASATQRAGRAGRTRSGRVYRLYSSGELRTRPERDVPEIQRADLTEVVLSLATLGRWGARAPAWLDPPPAAAVAAAEEVLRALGALDAAGSATEIGRRMAALPVPPRLARLALEGARRGVADAACTAAALLAERDLRLDARGAGLGPSVSSRAAARHSGPSDVLELIERFDEAASLSFDGRALRAAGLDERIARAVEETRRRLARLVRDEAPAPADEAAYEQALGLAVLAAFPDRVARRRKAGSRELVLASGATAGLAETSVVTGAALLTTLDVGERGGTRGAQVRLASAIEPEWLLELAADRIRETAALEWNERLGRVDRVTRATYGAVVLDATVRAAPPSPEAAQLLAVAAAQRARGREGDALAGLVARVAFLARSIPELGLDAPDEAALDALLGGACDGLTSLAELDAVGLEARLVARLGAAGERALREDAPERMGLPGGRTVAVHYEPGRPPWLESRLQDFFGMADGPRIARGRVAVVLHLLAPNQRAVQVTTDLAGFWARHYPSLRRELMRRYPRHAWPEDGASATPPAPRPPRRP